MVDWKNYYKEKKEEKKFFGVFSIFVVVAIVLGVLLALMFWMTNTIKEREEITSRALFDLSMLTRKILEENKTQEATVPQPEIIHNCTRIETFRIYNLHDPFLMIAVKEPNSSGIICQRAIYNKFPERVEITYYGNFYSHMRQKNVAVLEYRCFINNTLYNRQYAYIAQDDTGMFVEVLKLAGQIDYVSRALLVMPERKDDYCFVD